MGRNIEIKARLHAPPAQRRVAEQLADGPAVVLEQRDTFFDVPQGRLKLRQLDAERGELIHYVRSDQAGPRASDYLIVPTAEPEALRVLLSAALGVRGEVRKRRALLMCGQTRIHLDEVADLGDFLELEVVLEPAQPAAEGELIARELMRRLDVRDEDLVEGAYLDLLASSDR